MESKYAGNRIVGSNPTLTVGGAKMHKSKIPKRKPQQKKPTEFELLKDALRHGNMVWVPNGTGWSVPAFLQTLGPEKSNVKFLKGGYNVVETSKIRTECPR